MKPGGVSVVDGGLIVNTTNNKQRHIHRVE
jgi:hypothetical protein